MTPWANKITVFNQNCHITVTYISSSKCSSKFTSNYCFAKLTLAIENHSHCSKYSNSIILVKNKDHF